MSFGNRLSSILEERSMTRADLCRLTGLTSGHLTPYIKNPNRSPQLSTACKIALALDVSLDYLGGLIDEPRPIQRDESGRPVFPNLTPSEHEIVDAYRDSDARGQENILETARREKRAQGLPEADVREAK